eukprot:TRINITY_DN34334_c0_g1_i1.p1 TRINITY_DN34334_c0_g1~~TRINITY_DN34334_c0_g1_i1.p1  ORF type:complete len:329 (+),score=51.85 TRINITY_DN34334_c0_g1_i1:92-988(+)
MPLSASLLLDRYKGSDVKKKLYSVEGSSLQIESVQTPTTTLNQQQRNRRRPLHSARSRTRKWFREANPFSQNPSIPAGAKYVGGLSEADLCLQSESVPTCLSSDWVSKAASINSHFQELADRYICSLSDEYEGITINPDQPATWPSCDPMSTRSTKKTTQNRKQDSKVDDSQPVRKPSERVVEPDVIDVRPRTRKKGSHSMTSSLINSEQPTRGRIRRRSSGRRKKKSVSKVRKNSSPTPQAFVSSPTDNQTVPSGPSADFTPLLDTLARIPLDIPDDESSDIAISSTSSTADYLFSK